jgi:hypothetical protein
MSLLSLISVSGHQIQGAKKRRITAPSTDVWSSVPNYHGNIAHVTTLKNWMGKQRDQLEVAVVTGPTGAGKSSLVHRCARELGLGVHVFSELNQETLASALLCPGFQPSSFCVVLDEIVPIQLLESLKAVGRTNPLILTATHKVKLPKGVKHLAVQLKRLSPGQLSTIAREFSPRSTCSTLEVESLVQQCRGDARRLIDSLQLGFFTGDPLGELEAQMPPDLNVFDAQAFEDLGVFGGRLPEFGATGNPAVARASRLACLVRGCTSVQLADELGLLPSYRHTVDSIFSRISDSGNNVYPYQHHHDPEDNTTTANLKLLKRENRLLLV